MAEFTLQNSHLRVLELREEKVLDASLFDLLILVTAHTEFIKYNTTYSGPLAKQ